MSTECLAVGQSLYSRSAPFTGRFNQPCGVSVSILSDFLLTFFRPAIMFGMLAQ